MVLLVVLLLIGAYLFRDQIAGLLVRKTGEGIQRSLTGGALFSDVAVDVGKQSIGFGEQIQHNLFGGLLIK